MPSIDDLTKLRIEEQDLSSADLTLAADRGESLEILAREISGANDEDSIEESVDETTMLHYFGGQDRETLFQSEYMMRMDTDYLGYLAQMGFDLPTIKVPAGTTYRVNNLNDNGNARVLYRDYNSERFDRTDPGAPSGSQRTMILTGQEETTITQNSTEVNEVQTSAVTGGLPTWPYENDVPQNREYDVCALAVRGEEDPAGGGSMNLTGVRLNSEETDFLARTSAVVGDILFFYPDADPVTRQPFIFRNPHTGEPWPITFEPGDELNIELEAEETTNNSDVSVSLIASVICRERRF